MSGVVTLERPAGAQVLRELNGRVGAPARQVFAELCERVDPQGESGIAVDRDALHAVVQGGYWYRGEYLVEPDGDGARVTLTIVNVAPGSKLLGRLTGRGVLRSAPGEFARLLAGLG